MGEAKRRKRLDPNWGKENKIESFTDHCFKTGVKAGELFCFKLQKVDFIPKSSLVSFFSEEIPVFVNYESPNFPETLKLALNEKGDDLYLVAAFLPDIKTIKTAQGKLIPLKMVVCAKGKPEDILAGAKAKIEKTLGLGKALLEEYANRF